MNASSIQALNLWPLVAYFFFVVVLMAGIMALSYIAGERHTARAADEPFESGIVPTGSARLRLSVRFYLIAMFFVIFDVEALFLFAWAGYIEALVFIGILLVALAYLWRLGALDWGGRKRPPRHGKGSNNAMVVKQGKA